MLDVPEQLDQLLIADGIRQHPHHGIELIHCAIGFDPQVILGNTLASEESGFPLISGFCIDFERHSWLVIHWFIRFDHPVDQLDDPQGTLGNIRFVGHDDNRVALRMQVIEEIHDFIGGL